MSNQVLRVLLVAENEGWTAVGLEHAVFSWGDHMEQAIDRFSENLWLELAQSAERRETSLSAIPPAPPLYFDLAKSARKLADPIKIEPPPIPALPAIASDTVPKLVGHIAA